MAGRVAGGRLQGDGVVQREIVVDQQGLPGGDHGFAIVAPDIARRLRAARRRLLPRRVFALVEDVFRLREGRHPAAVHQARVPAAMVDMQVGAEDVVDILEAQPLGGEAVQPGLLRKIHRRRVALVLAGAGIDQDGVLRRAHHEGLVGDDHPPGRRVEHHRVQRCQVLRPDRLVIGREHLGRPAPGAVALDDAGDADVADP